MQGENNLSVLLSNMQPKLQKGRWVFATVGSEQLSKILQQIEISDLQGFYQESEGSSLILEEAQAKLLALECSEVFAAISLSIHSSLEAVGLTAAISGALAQAGISANVVAAFYHDHIYVPYEKAEAAMQCLEGIAAKE
ncbi:MAG: ACT domain-containing protein [Cellvibrionaceae bacterium]|nr:ACT domain-containing protein [Cellvibrionaceae bacterium]